MSADDGGPGDREIAVRVFAAEYDDADYSYSESDEERAPNYVVTPTGARINRLFVVGVLTEVEPVNEEMLRARVVDPTGAFVVYAGQYQPDALAFLERTDPPAFVAVTGKARTFEPDDADRVYTSVRPESISDVDADTRDRWVVQTARQTLDRVETMAGALAGDARGDDLEAALRERGVAEELAAGIPRAIDHYGTTPTYLAAVRDLAVGALRVVAGDQEEIERPDVAPDEPGEVTATDLAGGDAAVGAAAAATASTESPAEEAAEESPETDAAAEHTAAADEGASTEGAAGVGASTDVTAESPAEEPAETGATEPETVDEPATAEETDVEPEQEPADAAAETDAGASTESLTDGPPEADAIAESAETADTGGGGAVESEPVAGDGTEPATGDEGDELGDFDGEFELDQDERQEIEEEYGTEFSTGSEVEEPGAAGIEPEAPQPEEEPDDAAAPAEASEPEPDASEPEPPADEQPAEDVDLEDAVLETMRELDDGDGVDREAVVSAVVETYGADREAVEDTIQDALMSGQCYEPAEDTLKAI